MAHNTFVLYIYYDRKTQNIVDFIESIEVNIKYIDVNITYYIQNSIIFYLFHKNHLMKLANFWIKLKMFINEFKNDILFKPDVLLMINKSDIIKYIKMKIKKNYDIFKELVKN